MIQSFADWLVYGIFGLDSATKIGQAVNFFFYGSLKILILLFLISAVMGIINAYFPVDRLRNFLQTLWAGLPVGVAVRCHHAILLVLEHSAFHRFRQKWHSAGGDILVPDHISAGQ